MQCGRGFLRERGGEILDETMHLSAIRSAAERAGVDPLLVYSVVFVESRFRKEAQSHKGAAGLMQLMPTTAREVAARHKIDLSEKGIEDRDQNLLLGALYLRELLDDFGGDTILALAAYNGGPTAVRRWIEEEGETATIDSFPKRETRRYVEEVLKTRERLERWRRAWRKRNL